MIMFRFSTSVRTQDNITSHFCLIARRIGTPYHQMIISGSSIGRNNNIMMMYFCILQTGNIIYLVKSKNCVFLSGCPGIMSVVVKIIMNIDFISNRSRALLHPLFHHYHTQADKQSI